MSDIPLRIIGIDPGYGRCGFAIIERTVRGNETLLHSQCLSTPASHPFTERLALVAATYRTLTTTYHPTLCSMERVYFSTNQKTAMHVAEVRGALILITQDLGIMLHEFGPNEVKLAVAGDGGASKRQVMTMVSRLIHLPAPITYDDEYDAIALALTASASTPPTR